MKIVNTLRVLVTVCTLAFTAHATAAPILLVSNGILTGATGVVVGAKLYDVTFADGTCSSLFNGCKQSDLPFSNSLDAFLAFKALLDQVLIDGPQGNFDSVPSKTFGCTNVSQCNTYIPYEVNAGLYYAAKLENFGSNLIDIRSPRATLSMGFNSTSNLFTNFAVFTPTAADIPEPSSIALISLAMAGLAFTRRRKA